MNAIQTIALFGGSGATGRSLISQALVRGWRVNALVRKGSSIRQQHAHLNYVVGGFDEAYAVDDVIAGSDAVISVIGARPPYTDTFCAAATRAMIASMQRRKVTRIICQTGAMIGNHEDNWSWPFTWMARSVHKKYSAMMADRLEQERLIMASHLDWTIVKPSRLTQGARTGQVRAGTDLKMGLMSKIARVELASFLLDQVTSDTYLHQAVFVRA